MRWNGKLCGWCWESGSARGMHFAMAMCNTSVDFVLRAASLIGLAIPVFDASFLLLIAFSLVVVREPEHLDCHTNRPAMTTPRSLCCITRWCASRPARQDLTPDHRGRRLRAHLS